jgi:alpha-ketoglutaric semialdehyde dehydrogenase
MTGPPLASLVDGLLRDGEEVVADINPAAPDEAVAMVTLAGPDLAGEAVDAAAAAFPAWRDTPPPARGEVLRRAADLVDERADDIGRDLAREEGKTLVEAVGETRRAAAIIRYYAAQTLEPDGETYPSHSALVFLYARREPLGVVAAITPWNFPIAIPLKATEAGKKVQLELGGKNPAVVLADADFFTQWKTVYLDAPADA